MPLEFPHPYHNVKTEPAPFCNSIERYQEHQLVKSNCNASILLLLHYTPLLPHLAYSSGHDINYLFYLKHRAKGESEQNSFHAYTPTCNHSQFLSHPGCTVLQHSYITVKNTFCSAISPTCPPYLYYNGKHSEKEKF